MDNNKLQLLFNEVAKSLKLSLEEVMSLYVYFGDDLFFLLKFLCGKTIHFPVNSPVVAYFNSIQDFRVIDITEFVKIDTPDCSISPKLLKAGDSFTYNGNKYLVQGTPIHFDEHYLAVVKDAPKEI